MVADALRLGRSQLCWLSLAFNALGDAGAYALGLVLRENDHLRTLKLGGNSISSRGATVLAFALRSNSALTALDLDNNPINTDGIRAFSRALNFSKTYTDVSLRGCLPRRTSVDRAALGASHGEAAAGDPEPHRAAVVALARGIDTDCTDQPILNAVRNRVWQRVDRGRASLAERL
jgi:hypothetical protein